MREDIIYYLHIYNPYRFRNKNYNDVDSNRLIQFKYGDPLTIYDYYEKLMNSKMIKYLRDKEDVCVACVPSHNPKNQYTPIHELVDLICEETNFINGKSSCKRFRFINKLSKGGLRDKSIHINSIRVVNKELIKGKTVLLLDDITTTGNSMYACHQLLKQSGANDVYKIALAHTPKYEETVKNV